MGHDQTSENISELTAEVEECMNRIERSNVRQIGFNNDRRCNIF